MTTYELAKMISEIHLSIGFMHGYATAIGKTAGDLMLDEAEALARGTTALWDELAERLDEKAEEEGGDGCSTA